MAANPKYTTNIIAKTTYEQEIEGIGLRQATNPPYYPKTMINEIIKAKNDKLDIITMTGKEWYKKLLNIHMLQTYNNDSQQWELKTSKIEFLMPHINHQNKYENIHMRGLNSKTKSTLFKFVNDLLPTNERLSKIQFKESNQCDWCARVENLGHVLVRRRTPIETTVNNFINAIVETVPGVTLEQITQWT